MVGHTNLTVETVVVVHKAGRVEQYSPQIKKRVAQKAWSMLSEHDEPVRGRRK